MKGAAKSLANTSWLHVWLPSADEEEAIRTREQGGQEIASPEVITGHPEEKAVPEANDEQTKASKDNEVSGKRNIVITRINSEDHRRQMSSESPPDSPSKAPMLDKVEEEAEKAEEPRSPGLTVVRRAYLADVLPDIMKSLRVKCWTSSRSNDGRFLLVSFCVPSAKVEECLASLHQHGIGNNDHTSISVVPSKIHLRGKSLEACSDEISNNATAADGSDGEQDIKLEQKKVSKFYDSIKSRMLVAEVVASIRSGGEFTFDYLVLLVLASTIAFFGLVENSSVVLVASMLVSPIMGPILGGIFGTVIRDAKLRNEGVRNELISLFICLFLGATLGLLLDPWMQAYGVTQWPTQEMLSRGQLRSLYVGAFIAVPSGAGVALSVLGGNAGSLVGVAISASLLPPAVNCGVFLSVAVTYSISGNDYLIGHILDSDPMASNSSLPLYVPSYSTNLGVEAVALGLISFLLTVINIVCIIITGIIILKVKEVTPEKIPQTFSTFWKRDVKAHRDYYNTLKNSDPKQSSDALLREAREVLGIGINEDGLAGTFLQSVFERAHEENTSINIREWVTTPHPGAAAASASRLRSGSRRHTFSPSSEAETTLMGARATVRNARFRNAVEAVLEDAKGQSPSPQRRMRANTSRIDHIISALGRGADARRRRSRREDPERLFFNET